jgi:hypothetical protein
LGSGLNPDEWRISLEPPVVSLQAHDAERALIEVKPAVPEITHAISVAPDVVVAWTEEQFMVKLLDNYQNEELTIQAKEAVEKVFEFASQRAADIGWMTNKTGSFSPKFPRLSRRSPFALNTKGELTLLFGQLNTTPEEQLFANSWRGELEQVFGVERWSAFYPVLKADQWMNHVNEFLETIAWRLEG